MIADKTRWQLVPDSMVEALEHRGKWHPGDPFWVMKDGRMYVEVNEEWLKWKAGFTSISAVAK